MKMKFMSTIAALMILSATVSAQAVSADSIGTLKQQKTDLKVSKDINDRKLKLAKLENSVDEKTRDLQKANDQAQQSANDNADAASKLSANPNDKSLAKRADKTANDAKRDSRRARKAAKELEDLNKDIADLKSKIADDEKKLSVVPAQTNP